MKKLKTFGLTFGLLIALSSCKKADSPIYEIPPAEESVNNSADAVNTDNTGSYEPQMTQEEQDRADTEAMNRKMGNPDDMINGNNERRQEADQQIQSQKYEEAMRNQ